MRTFIAIVFVVAVTAAALSASDVLAMGFGREGAGFGKMGRVGLKKQSGGAPPTTSLRITNTGDFRVINTGDSRIIAP